MTKYNLRNHASAQCHIEVEDGIINFISYTTRVITMKQDELKNRIIECTGTYSATTRRQISWFLREYAPDLCYQDMKKIVGEGFVAI